MRILHENGQILILKNSQISPPPYLLEEAYLDKFISYAQVRLFEEQKLGA